MERKFYKTGSYIADHSTFGGLVYSSDFDTDSKVKNNKNGSVIASRIMSDLKFDEQCRKNYENRSILEKTENYNMEEI